VSGAHSVFPLFVLACQVVKNKPAYFRQAQSEVMVLRMLNDKYDQSDSQHIVR
jgi:hypothetical protein